MRQDGRLHDLAVTKTGSVKTRRFQIKAGAVCAQVERLGISAVFIINVLAHAYGLRALAGEQESGFHGLLSGVWYFSESA